MRLPGTHQHRLQLSLACAALWLAGCQLLLGFEDFERGTPDADAAVSGRGAGQGGSAGQGGQAGRSGSGGQAGDAGGPDDAGTPPPPGVDGGTPAPAPCGLSDALATRFDGLDPDLVPADHDEDMVEVRRPDDSCFLIDRFEVSVAQYAELLANDDVSARADDGACSFKAELSAPGDGVCGDASPAPELPATCVDWCDARRYCDFHGLELCRGEFPSEAQIDPMRSDWYAACADSGDGNYDRIYPYGTDYEDKLCNGADNPASGCPADCAPFAVTGGTGCVAASGAQNLSGNAAEWTAACHDSTGPDDSCRVSGGSYGAESMALACDALFGPPRKTRLDSIGFRCCFYGE
jgi:formylglycine-generating enzyme required for sulfatase activity